MGQTDHRHLSPLRGRDQELAQLTAGIDRLAGGQGSIVVVSGPPGSGKSRLLHEARAAARARALHVYPVTGDPDGELRPGGGLLSGLMAGPDPVLDPERVLELSAAPEQRYWLLEEIEERLEQAALAHPLLITVDDLQWCDDLTMTAVRALPRRLSAHAVMWVFGTRAAVDRPGHFDTLARLAVAGGTTVPVDLLDDAAAARMAADLLGTPLDPGQLTVLRGTGNRPMLINELCLGLREEGSLPQAGPVSTDGIPARFRASVQRRIARLGPDARALLEVASVLSRRVSVNRLADLLERPVGSLLTPLREALTEDLLFEDEGELWFRHDLVRDTVRATVPIATRRALRRRAADLFAREGASTLEVAGLMADSAEAGDTEAITVLRAAAAEVAAGSPTTAADLTARALDLAVPGSDTDRELRVEHVRLLWSAGRIKEATAAGQSLLEEGVEPAVEAALRIGVAAASSQFSFAETVRQCERAAALQGLTDVERAPILSLMGLNLMMFGDIARADEVLTEALRVAGRTGDEAARSLVTAALSATAFHHHEWVRSTALADEAIRIAAEAGADEAGWLANQWRGWLDTLAGHPARALAHAEDGIRAAQRTGQASLLRQWSMDRARILFDAGRLEDARAEAEGVMSMADELGAGNYADCLVLVTLGRIAVHTGDLALARRYDAEAERMRSDEAPLVRRSGQWLGALVAHADSDPGRARDLLRETVATLDEPGPSLGSPPDPADLVVLTRLTLELGERSWAGTTAALLGRMAGGNPGYEFLAAIAGHARALVDDDPVALAAAVERYRQFPRPLPLAGCLEDLARALHRAGPGPGGGAPPPAGDGVAPAEEALTRYEEAGAVADADRCRELLRKLGVRRPAPTGADRWAALTVVEREVVRRVAEGATNREVAAAMFLSPHTVSTHLYHAFAKLGINSRVELTRLAVRHPGLGERS